MRLSVDYWKGLNRFLDESEAAEIWLTFEEIETLLGRPLPAKFRRNVKYWQERGLFPRVAGFAPGNLSVEGGGIRFRRTSREPAPQRRQRGTARPDEFWQPVLDALEGKEGKIVPMSLAEIEARCGGPIPESAWTKPSFWRRRVYPWSRLGWSVQPRLGARTVFFTPFRPRRGRQAAPPPVEAKTTPARRGRPPKRLAAMPAIAADAWIVEAGTEQGPKSAPARSLFTSPAFRAGRWLAERSGSPWFILCGLAGLVLPDEIMAPHPPHLARLAPLDTRKHRERVFELLRMRLKDLRGKQIAFSGSAESAARLAALLASTGATVRFVRRDGSVEPQAR